MPGPSQPEAGGDLLAAALKAHRAGRIDDAEAGYRAVLDAEPNNAIARHFSGVIALQRGDPVAAEAQLRTALALRPRDAAVHANLGLALMALHRHGAAAAALRAAVTLVPTHVDGWYNLGLACQAGGDSVTAIEAYGRALELDRNHWQALASLARLLTRDGRPGHALDLIASAAQGAAQDAGVQMALCDAYRQLGDAGLALRHAQQAVALAGNDGEALAMLSTLHRQTGDDAAALSVAQRAVRVAPALAGAHRSLGMAYKAHGDLTRACDAFEKYLLLGRAPQSVVDAGLPTYTQTSLSKLRHDAEQFDYLAEANLLPAGCAGVATTLRDIHDRAAARLPEAERSRVFTLPLSDQLSLSGRYNRLHRRMPAAQQQPGALGDGVRRDQVEQAYVSRAPGICWIDGFLSDGALDGLRRFCLESTLWFDFNHNNGYLGAYLEEGFFCPLLLQIADELRLALPGIFAAHRLQQMWAYKYDSDLAGIDLHADFAAVNVNFWITPDSANRDPESGGLVVYDVKAPAAQRFADYNSSEPGVQARIRAYLAEHNAGVVKVPYRANRAVIFHSDLFHHTDTIRFHPGYLNRRINVTMLFGRRNDADAG